MNRMLRQICSAVLCTMMILGSLMPGAAALEADTPNGQIGNHFEADDNTGELPDVPRLDGDTSKNYAGGWVKTDKTIAAGERENEFLVTLDVSTKTEIQELDLSEDAAVVLVMDLSGSMNAENRLEKAKQAAQKFIEKYTVTDNENTVRKIAVVGFSGQQRIGGSWGNPGQKGIIAAKAYQQWTDAGDPSALNAIEGMNAEGGTCLQAGLILAKNLLNSDDVADVANKSIIVLTDGRPTYYLTDEAANDESIQTIGEPNTILGAGTSTDHSTHVKTETAAKSILDAGIHVYGIFLGSDRISCSNDRSCQVKNKTGEAWMMENCGFITYAVDNAGDLSKMFEDISELIRLQARAWIAEDPMGEMFEFAGFVKEPEEKNEYFYDSSDKKVQWNLRMAKPEDTTEDGYSVYRLTYKVKLNTLADGYKADEYYPVNGVTSVTWLIEKTTESGASDIDHGTAYFNVPSAKGYAADISFNKTDGKGRPLADAKFGLYYKETLIAAAVSDNSGKVCFENVPSGHSYSIVEESAPEGYIADTEKYDIKVSYGNLTGTIGEDNTIINLADAIHGGLTVSKNISGVGADPEDEFTFTITLSDAGITGTYGDLEFTDGRAHFKLKDGESVTALELPSEIGYTVTENEAEGYTPGVNGESGATVTGTIPKDDIAFAAYNNFYTGGRTDPEPEYGGFIISKTISGDGAVKTDEFAFTVTLDDEIDGSYGNIDFKNGTADFTLKGGESVTASDLPAGIGYTVTETDSKNYDVTVNGENVSSITGKVETDRLAEIEFNNYKAGKPATSSAGIDITKTVKATGNIIPDWENRFGFVISKNLPGKDDEAEVAAMPSIAITGTGTDSTVYKFDNLDFSGDNTETYYIWEGSGYEPFWKYDETVYRVKFTKDTETGEVDQEYAKTTGFGDEANFEPASDISFTNVYHYEDEPAIDTDSGDLTISKTVSRGDSAKKFTFTVTLDDPEVNGKYGDLVFNDGIAVLELKDGESATAEELPSGAGYTVKESDNSGYTVKVNGTRSAIAEGKIIEDETAFAAFLNDKIPDTGSVKITKKVTGKSAPTESIPYSFKASVCDADGNTVAEDASYTFSKADGTSESGKAEIRAYGYEFQLKDGESIVFGDIEEGRRFGVEEISTGEFQTTAAGLTDGVCEISANETELIEYINDYGDSTDIPTTSPKSLIPDTTHDPQTVGPSHSPQTGDSSKVMLWSVIACLSMLGFVIAASIKR